MKDLFKDILDIKDVQGIVFFSFDGEILFKEFLIHPPEEFQDGNWPVFIHSLSDIQEAELIFENTKFYIRKTGSGYLLIIMGISALMAMIRLNCGIILPSFDQTKKKTQGLWRFFKKK